MYTNFHWDRMKNLFENQASFALNCCPVTWYLNDIWWTSLHFTNGNVHNLPWAIWNLFACRPIESKNCTQSMSKSRRDTTKPPRKKIHNKSLLLLCFISVYTDKMSANLMWNHFKPIPKIMHKRSIFSMWIFLWAYALSCDVQEKLSNAISLNAEC